MAYAVPLLCLGSYVAPAPATRLAAWDRVEGIEARYAQGPDHGARLVSWKNRDALLGSVVGYHTGEPGYQAVVTQAHLAGHPDARVWISNPGEEDPFGSRRPSYWAGDGFMPRAAQWRNLAILHYRLDDPRAIPWTHAYARRDAFEEYRVMGEWLFLRQRGGVAAILAANGLAPMTQGPTAGYELRSPGRRNSWLVRVDSLERFGTFDHFVATITSARLEVAAGERLSFTDPRLGTVALDWSGHFTVEGVDRRHDVRSVEPVLEEEPAAP
jgi:hypothetical protein